MLTRRIRTALKSTLPKCAPLTLEKQLSALTAAESTVWSGISAHLALFPSDSDPAPLGRAAAVVRHRGNVTDGCNLKTGCLQSSDC